MLRYLLILTLFVTFTTGHTGCNHDHGDEETPPTVVEVLSEEDKAALAEKLNSLDFLLSRPLEERSQAAKEYMLTYVALKEKDETEALKALRTAFYILAKGEHPLMEEWLTLVPRVFGVDEGLLTDLLRLNEIELQIARENKEDPKYLKALEEQVEQFKTEIDNLKAQGVDPEEFKVPFKIELEEEE